MITQNHIKSQSKPDSHQPRNTESSLRAPCYKNNRQADPRNQIQADETTNCKQRSRVPETLFFTSLSRFHAKVEDEDNQRSREDIVQCRRAEKPDDRIGSKREAGPPCEAIVHEPRSETAQCDRQQAGAEDRHDLVAGIWREAQLVDDRGKPDPEWIAGMMHGVRRREADRGYELNFVAMHRARMIEKW